MAGEADQTITEPAYAEVIRDELNTQISLIQEMMRRLNDRSQLVPLSHSDNAIIRHYLVRKRFSLRGKMPAEYLLKLLDRPDHYHAYKDFVINSDTQLTNSVKNSIRVSFSSLRASLREAGLDHVIHNQSGKGYYLTADDAKRIETLINTETPIWTERK